MNNLKQGFASFVKGRNFSPTIVTAMIIAIFVVANALIYVAYSVLSVGDSTVEQEDLSITDAAKDVFEKAAAAGKKLTVTEYIGLYQLSSALYRGKYLVRLGCKNETQNV